MRLHKSLTSRTILPLLGFGLIIGAILLDIFFPVLSPERSQKLYEVGQHKCGNEVWFIIEDIGPILSHREAPYPTSYSEAVGDHILDYKCTEAEALKFQVSAQKWGWVSLALLLLVPASTFAGTIVLIIWLLLIIRSWRQKPDDEKP